MQSSIKTARSGRAIPSRTRCSSSRTTLHSCSSRSGGSLQGSAEIKPKVGTAATHPRSPVCGVTLTPYPTANKTSATTVRRRDRKNRRSDLSRFAVNPHSPHVKPGVCERSCRHFGQRRGRRPRWRRRSISSAATKTATAAHIIDSPDHSHAALVMNSWYQRVAWRRLCVAGVSGSHSSSHGSASSGRPMPPPSPNAGRKPGGSSPGRAETPPLRARARGLSGLTHSSPRNPP